jgi:hypothetical protein
MKELEPLMMLEGRWTGKGKGSYGPFSAEMDVEVRGRWLLMRQKITLPIVAITTYVSTQVYGYDDAGLTLDFFDTAGSFKFRGAREGDQLQFHFRDATVQKTSVYWKEGEELRYDYVSVETRDDGKEKKTHFEGRWKPRDAA